jgi:hypothetical protein
MIPISYLNKMGDMIPISYLINWEMGIMSPIYPYLVSPN